MTTRQDYQISIEVCKFANIINDLLDACAYNLHNLDANTGDILRVVDVPGTPDVPTTYRPAEVGDIKELVNSRLSAVQTYYAALNQFIDGLTLIRVRDALLAWQIDAQSLRDDILAMRNIAITIGNQIGPATTFAQLEIGAVYIDNNVPKLPLFRRRWDL